jgi:AAA domain
MNIAPLNPDEQAAWERLLEAFPQPNRWTRDDHPAYDALVTARAIMNGDGLAHELRVIGEMNGERVTESGRFDTAEILAHWAERCDGKADVYMTVNPSKFSATHILSRGRATSDGQIAKIRWLAIDYDAEEEPVGLREHLDGIGFPEPLVGFSGHGWWLLFRVDQENTKEATELRRRVLAALKTTFPAVDTTSYNASRVMRCFGTLNVKDPSAPIRSRVVSVPREFHVVSDVLLERVAETQPELFEPSPEQGTPAQLEPIVAKLAERGITVLSSKPAGKPGTIHQLSACPFHPDKNHQRAAALYAWDDGNVHFECMGERCQEENHRILDLLDLLGLRAGRAPGNQKVLRAIDVQPREVKTTFGGRIVLNDLNAAAGREKVGKGLYLARLAADLSNGILTDRAETVLYVSAEEQLETVQRPRLEAAEADLERVLLMPMGTLGLPDAIPELVGILEEYGCSWWILDPINKHFSRNMDPDSKRDVAMVLGELAAAANTHQATVIGSIHLGRGKEGVSPADTWAHSMEFRRAIRSSTLIGKIETDGDDERTIVHDFSNYGKTAPAIKAKIITAANGVGAMMLGAVDPFIEPEDLFWRPKASDGSTRRECADRILAVWIHGGRPKTMPSSAMSSVGNAYANTTVSRARQLLGITVRTDSEGKSGIRNLWDFTEVTL